MLFLPAVLLLPALTLSRNFFCSDSVSFLHIPRITPLFPDLLGVRYMLHNCTRVARASSLVRLPAARPAPCPALPCPALRSKKPFCFCREDDPPRGSCTCAPSLQAGTSSVGRRASKQHPPHAAAYTAQASSPPALAAACHNVQRETSSALSAQHRDCSSRCRVQEGEGEGGGGFMS